MLSPEYLLRVSEGGEAIAETLHDEIIKQIVERVAIRLDRGDDYILTARDKWQIEVLQDSGMLREEIEKILAKHTGLMQEEIAEAMHVTQEEAAVFASMVDAARNRRKIEAARETNDQAVRSALYKDAMGYILDLAVELPVYQRNVLYAYNSKVIKSSSLPKELNPYSSPLDRIWEIEFAG